jgi:hypothetical protein
LNKNIPKSINGTLLKNLYHPNYVIRMESRLNIIAKKELLNKHEKA